MRLHRPTPPHRHTNLLHSFYLIRSSPGSMPVRQCPQGGNFSFKLLSVFLSPAFPPQSTYTKSPIIPSICCRHPTIASTVSYELSCFDQGLSVAPKQAQYHYNVEQHLSPDHGYEKTEGESSVGPEYLTTAEFERVTCGNNGNNKSRPMHTLKLKDMSKWIMEILMPLPPQDTTTTGLLSRLLRSRQGTPSLLEGPSVLQHSFSLCLCRASYEPRISATTPCHEMTSSGSCGPQTLPRSLPIDLPTFAPPREPANGPIHP